VATIVMASDLISFKKPTMKGMKYSSSNNSIGEVAALTSAGFSYFFGVVAAQVRLEELHNGCNDVVHLLEVATEDVDGSALNSLDQLLHLSLLELFLERAIFDHVLHDQLLESLLSLVFGALVTGKAPISLPFLLLLGLEQRFSFALVDFLVNLLEFVAVLELRLPDTTFNSTERASNNRLVSSDEFFHPGHEPRQHVIVEVGLDLSRHEALVGECLQAVLTEGS